MFVLLAIAGCGDNRAPDRLLVFSRTVGYRHADSIDAGTRVLGQRLADEQVAVDFTEDPAVFSPDNLARYRAIMFMYTQGDDIIEPDGKAAIDAFVRRGGGWIGIHSAASTEYHWPFYQELLVVSSLGHPPIQQATIDVEDRSHPATAQAPTPWPATDEWYNFPTSPRAVPGVRVLATIDETTYSGGTMGSDHPMIWCHERLGGRVFYSELGHVADRWMEPDFVNLVDGGIRWVIGRE